MEVRYWGLVAEGRLVFGQEALAGNLIVVVGVLILGLKVQLKFLVFHSVVDQTWGKTSNQVRHLASALERLVTTQVRRRSAADRLVASLPVVFECRS
jgi:hypothetical protein